MTRRSISLMLIGAGACLLAGPLVTWLFAQEQAPNRREVSVSARDYRFTPERIEVIKDDLVKLTVQSADHAYSFTIDDYRLSKRIPAGGTTTIEFRADQIGTFRFYSNLTNDTRHAQMAGELVVRAR